VAPITVGLGAALALIWILVETTGSSSDPWTLIRAGAHFGPAVRAGEWWRMVTATFLHGGLIHLVLNVYALWAFGPFVERLYGSTRFLIIYVLSGMAGFTASLSFGRGPLTVGASGCIFGVLGAAIAILLVRRGQWPEGWRRGMLMNFAFLVAVNVGIGFIMPMIDNAAHVGGLAGGLALGLLLAPGVLGSGDLARAALWAMATTAMAAVMGSAISLLTSDSTKLLTRLPTRPLRLDDVVLLAPEHWLQISDGRKAALFDRVGAIGELAGDMDPRLAERKITAALRADGNDGPGFEVACRRLMVGPTLCLRFPGSGRAAYLPLLKSMVATAGAADPGAASARP
jgi:membrane associated rhomboid family serine protease